MSYFYPTTKTVQRKDRLMLLSYPPPWNFVYPYKCTFPLKDPFLTAPCWLCKLPSSEFELKPIILSESLEFYLTDNWFSTNTTHNIIEEKVLDLTFRNFTWEKNFLVLNIAHVTNIFRFSSLPQPNAKLNNGIPFHYLSPIRDHLPVSFDNLLTLEAIKRN